MNEPATLESQVRELLRQAATNVTAPADTMARVRTRALHRARRRTAIATSALTTAVLLAFASVSPATHGATAVPGPTPSTTVHLGRATCGSSHVDPRPWWFNDVLEAIAPTRPSGP